MTSRTGWLLLGFAALGACKGDPPAQDGPVVTDTDTSEPHILPIDTYLFLPEDTAPTSTATAAPDHFVYIVQEGQWLLGSSVPPYGSLSGQLQLQEYVDTLDTAEPSYECDVRYSLTGDEVTAHTCPGCSFVMNVEHFVTSGDPSTCNDPDAPDSGEVWQLGFSATDDTILVNYHGTDVWLTWYDATQVGASVSFAWFGTLAIEVEDSGTM